MVFVYRQHATFKVMTQTPTKSRVLQPRILALFFTFVTGFTGLLYEVTWQRYLANLLGSQARAVAIILAVFLGGLSLGYAIFGRVSRKGVPSTLLRMTAYVEIGIGIWALIFPWFYQAAWQHSGSFSTGIGWIAILVDVFISFLLIGPPTVLMGGTLPLLTQALSRDVEDSAELHARVYAINTAGAFFGCFISGLFLLPAWGLRMSLYCAGVTNLLAGLGLIVVAKMAKEAGDILPQDPERAEAPGGKRPSVRFMLIAFIAGYYAITLQVILIRVVGISMGSSEYAFSNVVAAFICMLALGAMRVSKARVLLQVWQNQFLVALGGIALYLSIPYWPYYSYLLRTLLSSQLPSFYLFHLHALLVLCTVLLVPVGFMGSTMPLLFRVVRSRHRYLGSVVGWLYASNTIGCIAGALIGGYWLLYQHDLDGVFRGALICMVFSAFLALYADEKQEPAELQRKIFRKCAAGVLICIALFVTCLSPWNRERLAFGLFRERQANEYTYRGLAAFYEWYIGSSRIIAYKDDPNTSVSVSEHEAGADDRKLNNGATMIRNIRVNGKSDGETSPVDMKTMRFTGHLPMLFRKEPVKKAAVIGFGLGITAGTLTLYPEVEDVHCIEISPAVREFSPYFDFANYNVSKNSKVHWSIGDAYRVLRQTDATYNLIVSEPSNPWVVGVERLFTQEFYQVVRSKLTAQGIYVQWFHVYTISKNTAGTVFHTFSEAFPYIRIFVTSRDIIMLGSGTPFEDASLDRVSEVFQKNPEARLALEQVEVNSPESLFAHELWLPPQYFWQFPPQTLEFPRLAYAAGKDFFQGVDFDVWPFTNQTMVRPWSRRSASNAFFVGWIKRAADKNAVIREYVKTSCGTSEPKLFEDWQNANAACRATLSAFVLSGQISGEPIVNHGDVQKARALADEAARVFPLARAEVPVTAATIGEVEKLVQVFDWFDSPLTPLSPDKLLSASKPCGESLSREQIQCRAKLATALAKHGYGELAEKIVVSIEPGKSELGEDAFSLLERIVESARLAERAIPLQVASEEKPAAP